MSYFGSLSSFLDIFRIIGYMSDILGYVVLELYRYLEQRNSFELLLNSFELLMCRMHWLLCYHQEIAYISLEEKDSLFLTLYKTSWSSRSSPLKTTSEICQRCMCTHSFTFPRVSTRRSLRHLSPSSSVPIYCCFLCYCVLIVALVSDCLLVTVCLIGLLPSALCPLQSQWESPAAEEQ